MEGTGSSPSRSPALHLLTHIPPSVLAALHPISTSNIEFRLFHLFHLHLFHLFRLVQSSPLPAPTAPPAPPLPPPSHMRSYKIINCTITTHRPFQINIRA